MRRFITLCLLTAGHVVATVALLVLAFVQGMSRFDSGEPIGWLERVAERGYSVLSFPLVNWMSERQWTFPGVTGYIPIAINSLLWSIVILGVAAGYRRYGLRPRSTRSTD